MSFKKKSTRADYTRLVITDPDDEGWSSIVRSSDKTAPAHAVPRLSGGSGAGATSVGGAGSDGSADVARLPPFAFTGFTDEAVVWVFPDVPLCEYPRVVSYLRTMGAHVAVGTTSGALLPHSSGVKMSLMSWDQRGRTKHVLVPSAEVDPRRIPRGGTCNPLCVRFPDGERYVDKAAAPGTGLLVWATVVGRMPLPRAHADAADSSPTPGACGASAAAEAAPLSNE